jgi:hypothetical protein
MKSLKTFLVGLSALVAMSASAAEGLVTLTVQGGPATNEVQIAANQQVTVKTYLDQRAILGGSLYLSSWIELIKDGKTISLDAVSINRPGLPTIAGPATVRLIHDGSGAAGTYVSMVTLDITPAAYPPDRAVTVGPYSADMKVTMEMSTDLVNWTVAQNAAVYTNKPEARFFRIKLEKDIPSP